MPENVLTALEATIRSRKSADPESSYVASLFAAGLNKQLEKVGEEAVEMILAAKDHREGDVHLVAEVADLLFHTLVVLGHLEVPFEDVTAELERRFGVSGITEKANRGT